MNNLFKYLLNKSKNGIKIIPYRILNDKELDEIKIGLLLDVVLDKAKNNCMTYDEVQNDLITTAKKLFADRSINISNIELDKLTDLVLKLVVMGREKDTDANARYYLNISNEKICSDLKYIYVEQYEIIYPMISDLEKTLRDLNAFIVKMVSKANIKRLKNFPYIKEQVADIIISIHSKDSTNDINSILLNQIRTWYPELITVSINENDLNSIINQIIDDLKNVNLYQDKNDLSYSKK